MTFMQHRIITPILDRNDAWHFGKNLQHRFKRIAKAGACRILKQDQRQIGCIGNHFKMGNCHIGAKLTAHAHAVWRENQQRRRAFTSRHFCHRNSRMAAIGINPIYQRQCIPDLVKRFGQKLLLFGKAERVNFRRVAINRDRTKTRNIHNITQMFS